MYNLDVLGFTDMNKMTVRSVRPAPGTSVSLFDIDFEEDRDSRYYHGTLLGPECSSYDDYATECFNLPDGFTTEFIHVEFNKVSYKP